MQQLKKEILESLQQLKGSGKFASIHTADFIFPGLQVEGAGEIAYPVNELQARALIQSAHKAPFGKGTQTILDDNVRSAWEIDADKLTFSNPKWGAFLKKAINNIKIDLGLEDYEVDANFYKLLIYEEGDFFLPHKDSEKEKGMFGTLIIGLPSQYSGGELMVHYEGESVVADFAKDAGNYTIGYAAFYADCDHEVKPVTSGHRVCLTYNLIQKKAGKKIELQSLHSHASRIAEILSQYDEKNNPQPYIILLGHQYTPENFSDDGLKLNDRAKSEALFLAARKLGWYAKMCLVTSFLTGAPDYDGDYGYGDDGGDDDATMAEVYEESIYIKHWLESELPSLNNVGFEEDDLITSFALDEDEPVIKKSTGYMGNYGPDLEHWYHYGAVMIWSPQVNAQLLLSQDAKTQLDWIDYFNHSKQISDDEISSVRSVLSVGFKGDRYSKEEENFNAIAGWLIHRKEETFLLNLSDEQLQFYFDKIDVAHWIKLFNWMPLRIVPVLFEKAVRDITLPVMKKILGLIPAMGSHESLHTLATEQATRLPVYFRALHTKKKNQIGADDFENLFRIEKEFSPDMNWVTEIAAILTKSPKRQHIHHTLVPQLLSVKASSELTDQLLRFCREYLQKRVNKQPQPPANWSRLLPDDTTHKNQWQILKAFLESPDEKVFDYRKNQNERTALEYAIKDAVIDLKTETIRKGSPHTLRITKTQDAYQREMKDWHEDVALLEKISVKGK